MISVVTDTDSYKLGHFRQYPPNTTAMSSYFESRGGKYEKTVFFGLQYILKRYLTKKVTIEEVEYMKEFSAKHGLSFNYEGWKRIATVLDGKLPVKIRAVPEGSVIPVSNILMDVTSTDPETFWIVSWLETILSRLWYPTTIATNSWYAKEGIMRFLKMSSDEDIDSVKFKLHDFGSRGVSCQEQAMLGGAAHLISFLGSDTLAGIDMANRYYDCDMAGFSIEASEHSTMTMRGVEGEVEAFRNMIKQYGDGPIFACVSDSYDIRKACKELWGGVLKQDIIDMNATLVVRPDSGDPLEGSIQVIKDLDEAFGHIVNSKGLKVLNHVRVIWGDGIENKDVFNILHNLISFHGYSADNIAFGMGGGLLQKCNRDTQRFAFKASWAIVDGKEIDIYKEPVTDKGKNSKKGRLDLVEYSRRDSLAKYVNTVPYSEDNDSLLKPVFRDGEILREYSFDEIRKNSANKVYRTERKQWADHSARRVVTSNPLDNTWWDRV